MILVDTSVWIDHLRRGDAGLTVALESGEVLTHPFVIGEIALGSLRHREQVLEALGDLPFVMVAGEAEVSFLIERYRLYGRGIGYIDAHLLAATLITPGCLFWTRDKRLEAIATELAISESGTRSSGPPTPHP